MLWSLNLSSGATLASAVVVAMKASFTIVAWCLYVLLARRCIKTLSGKIQGWMDVTCWRQWPRLQNNFITWRKQSKPIKAVGVKSVGFSALRNPSSNTGTPQQPRTACSASSYSLHVQAWLFPQGSRQNNCAQSTSYFLAGNPFGYVFLHSFKAVTGSFSLAQDKWAHSPVAAFFWMSSGVFMSTPILCDWEFVTILHMAASWDLGNKSCWGRVL